MGFADLDAALTARPSAMVSASPELWDLLSELHRGGAYRQEFQAAWQNGVAFLAAADGLRGRVPLVVEWRGGQRQPGDEPVPADLRIDHVFLISCKYLSHIVSNSAPASVFDRLLAGGHGGRSTDWFAEVAPDAYQTLYEAVRAHLRQAAAASTAEPTGDAAGSVVSGPAADGSAGRPAGDADGSGGWPAGDAAGSGGWPTDDGQGSGGWPAGDAGGSGGWPAGDAGGSGGWPAGDAAGSVVSGPAVDGSAGRPAGDAAGSVVSGPAAAGSGGWPTGDAGGSGGWPAGDADGSGGWPAGDAAGSVVSDPAAAGSGGWPTGDGGGSGGWPAGDAAGSVVSGPAADPMAGRAAGDADGSTPELRQSQSRSELDELPSSVLDLTSAQRTLLQRLLGSGQWAAPLRPAAAAFSEAVAQATAARWQRALADSDTERALWRLLRIGSTPYFVLGAAKQGSLRLRIGTAWDWRQHFRIEDFEVVPAARAQPVVEWRVVVAHRRSTQRSTIEGHVEIRWSHGKFAQPPEAKVYLDTPHHRIPGYWPLS